MTHRLFIAIDLPAVVRQRLARLVAEPPRGVRPVQPLQMHLTLHFLGEADDASLAAVAAALPLVRRPPFTIALAGSGVFPPRGRPSVLWAGVDASADLHDLHDALADLVAGCGFAPERRPWTPHVTLARLTPAVPARWTKEFLDRHRHLSEAGIPVTAVCLYESMRTATGAMHVPAASIPLTGVA